MTCEAEYASQWVAMKQVCKDNDATLSAIPSKAHSGEIDVGAFRTLLSNDVCMVCVTHAPTNGGKHASIHGCPVCFNSSCCFPLQGLVNPVEEIGYVLAQFNKENTENGRRIAYVVDDAKPLARGK